MQSSDFLEIGLRRGFDKAAIEQALRYLTEEQVLRLAWMAGWVDTRHQHQVEPDGQWSVWLILGGRGAGKTRVGAEWLGMRAAMSGRDRNGKLFRGLVSAPTNNDLDGVCFEGESGLLSVIPGPLIADYNINKHRIKLSNGSIIGGISAEKSSRFRGPQWHCAWCDELAAWGDNGRDPQDAWDTMALSVRLGDDTRILATTTPRPLPHVRTLLADPGTVVTHASTYVNLRNLSGEFAKRILKYEGTKIGRQEIHAELIDSEEGGIIKRSDIRMWPAAKPLPKFEFVAMSIDPAYSEESYDKKSRESDPTACSVWGGFRIKNVPHLLLLDCWQEKLGFPELVDRVQLESQVRYGQADNRVAAMMKGSVMFGPHKHAGKRNTTGKGIDLILVEEKASGISLRQQLQKLGITTYPYNPGKADKLTRLHIVSPMSSSGQVWVPESTYIDPKTGKQARPGKFTTWAEPLLEQLCAFSGEGTTLHDDFVDTTTQAWRVMDDLWGRILKPPVKSGKQIIDEPATSGRRPRNPYG